MRNNKLLGIKSSDIFQFFLFKSMLLCKNLDNLIKFVIIWDWNIEFNYD